LFPRTLVANIARGEIRPRWGYEQKGHKERSRGKSTRREKISDPILFEYVKGRGRLVVAVGVAVGVH
jgi:hypothetical protein